MCNLLTILPGIIWDLESLGLLWDTTGPLGILIHYMGQCPAKSGLWGYNFITIKIARCTKQHIFATVLLFPFKFCILVPTPFLYVKIDFCDLHIFRAVDTTIINPAG